MLYEQQQIQKHFARWLSSGIFLPLHLIFKNSSSSEVLLKNPKWLSKMAILKITVTQFLNILEFTGISPGNPGRTSSNFFPNTFMEQAAVIATLIMTSINTIIARWQTASSIRRLLFTGRYTQFSHLFFSLSQRFPELNARLCYGEIEVCNWTGYQHVL